MQKMDRCVRRLEHIRAFLESLTMRERGDFRYWLQSPGETIVVPSLTLHMVVTFSEGTSVLAGYDASIPEDTMRVKRLFTYFGFGSRPQRWKEARQFPYQEALQRSELIADYIHHYYAAKALGYPIDQILEGLADNTRKPQRRKNGWPISSTNLLTLIPLSVFVRNSKVNSF